MCKLSTPPKAPSQVAGPGIIDIRQAAVELSLKTEVVSMFRGQDGPRKLPTLLLYDERGLQLFEKVNRTKYSRRPELVPRADFV